jgi:hypothetical protein
VLKCTKNKYIKYYKTNKPYSYLGWSIVFVFINVLGFSINNNISGEYIVNNKKYKFLKEQTRDRTGRQYCNYKGNVVLSNRYVNYKNHKFVSPNETNKVTKVSNMISTTIGFKFSNGSSNHNQTFTHNPAIAHNQTFAHNPAIACAIGRRAPAIAVSGGLALSDHDSGAGAHYAGKAWGRGGAGLPWCAFCAR